MPLQSVEQVHFFVLNMNFADSTRRDVRALAIFGTYLLVCSGLTILICRDLHRQHRRPTEQGQSKLTPRRTSYATVLFSVLAAVCLGITWFYMLSFFRHSYMSWAQHQAWESRSSLSEQQTFGSYIINVRIGQWLKDVQLFRDAWETVIQTPDCLFWAQPIFFITAGWSLYISKSAREREIPHAWAYMLLGQIVAISFAQNLFFLAVLLSRPIQRKEHPADRLLDNMVHTLVPLLTIPSVALISTYTNGPYFLPLLMLPHVALMLPPLYASTSRSLMKDSRSVVLVYCALLLSAVVLQVRVGVAVVANGSFKELGVAHLSNDSTTWIAQTRYLRQALTKAFFSHPAVSSVGSDVFLCLGSTALWIMLGRDGYMNVKSHDKHD